MAGTRSKNAVISESEKEGNHHFIVCNLQHDREKGSDGGQSRFNYFVLLSFVIRCLSNELINLLMVPHRYKLKNIWIKVDYNGYKQLIR